MAASARDIPSRPGVPGASASAHARLGGFLARHGAFVVLGLWTVAVTALLARYSVDSRLVFTDEANAVMLGRAIESAPSTLFDGNVARGPERMTSWMAALTAALSDEPARQFELLHLLNAFVQGLVIVPVWLAARQLGLSRWTALAPAAIASSGSFAFYGTTTLNTSVGLLSCGFMLWAMLRALRSPGFLSDLLVLATLFFVVLSRIGWAPLVGAIAPAALATIWFARPEGERLPAWLKALPLRLLRRHPLLSLGAVALLVALVTIGSDPLVGGSLYGGVRLKPAMELSTLWDNERVLFAHLALGTAVIPFMLGLPVLARGLWRPADPVEGGFAWLALASVLIFSYAYYYSMNEDRYFAVLAAPFVIAGALAVFKKPPPLWSTAVSAVLVTVLVATSYRWPVGDVYTYFIAPTSRFFTDVVLGKASYRLPGSRQTIAWVVLGLAAVATFAVAWIAGRRSAPRRVVWTAGTLVLAGLLAFQIGSLTHPARKFLDVVSFRGVSAHDVEFIDNAVAAAGQPNAAIGAAEPLQDDGAIQADLAAQMPFLQVFNRSLGSRFSVDVEGDDGEPVPGQATVDWRTGATTSGRTPPTVLVTMSGQATIGFDSIPIRSPPSFPWAELQQLRQPLRAEWIVRGTAPDRFGDGTHPMRVRVFPHGGQRCLTGIVNQHPMTDRRVPYRIAGGPKPIRGVADPGTPTPFEIRLRGTRPVTLTLTGGAGRLADGSLRSPGLFNLLLDGCSRR